MLKLLKIKYPKIHSVVDIPQDMQLETENGISITAKHNDEHKRMLFIIEAFSAAKDHKELFDIEMQVIGVFSYDSLQTDDEIRGAHLQAYEMVYPFVQTLFAELTSKAGIHPYFFEKITVNFEDVEVVKRESK